MDSLERMGGGRGCQADTDGESCPNPATGRAKSLAPDGKVEYLLLCNEHHAALRLQGVVGTMEALVDRVTNHAPVVMTKDAARALKLSADRVRKLPRAAVGGLPCAGCGRMLGEHDLPAIFIGPLGEVSE